MAMHSTVIMWFRNDLRLFDNKALVEACENGKKVIPVYCYDPRAFEDTKLDFPKTGTFRAKFIMESVEALRTQLKGLGSDLIVRKGKPEMIIPNIAQISGAKAVYASKEVTFEEKSVEKALEVALWRVGIDTRYIWQSTLVHLEDLPFPIKSLPEVFTKFRKEIESEMTVHEPLGIPKKFKKPGMQAISVSLESFGLKDIVSDSRRAINFRGGEEAGTNRIQEYFWAKDLLKNYKETRNGLLGADYSSKLSPWLAQGCLSPRYVYNEIRRYESERVENDSTYWLIFELLWRDFFRFTALKEGDKIFKVEGFNEKPRTLSENRRRFRKWMNGETGNPFVDANMTELKQTGFMSNRGRQNVASYLVNDMGVNWTWGAMYFESQLIDYDVCSNWCNWAYVAGVGNDPRGQRYFNTINQAKQYDPKGDYIKHWVPELKDVPEKYIHEPSLLTKEDIEELKLNKGSHYLKPV